MFKHFGVSKYIFTPPDKLVAFRCMEDSPWKQHIGLLL